jgi:hypothetical protein
MGQWCVRGQGLSGWRVCVGYKPRAVTLNESSLMNGKKEHDFLAISLSPFSVLDPEISFNQGTSR